MYELERLIQGLAQTNHGSRRWSVPLAGRHGGVMTDVILPADGTSACEDLRRIPEVADDIEVAGEAVDGLDAAKKVNRPQPDVIVMDASTLGM